MGTHPIFESDFDCLTGYEMSEAEVAPTPAAAPVAAAAGFTVETAVQEVLKQGNFQNVLSRGLNEAVRALERRDAIVCLLPENTQSQCSRLVTTRPSASGLVSASEIGRRTPERLSDALASSFDPSKTAKHGTSSRDRSEPRHNQIDSNKNCSSLPLTLRYE